jgi:hypothetical protein
MTGTAYTEVAINGVHFPVMMDFDYHRMDFGFSYEDSQGIGFHHQWGFEINQREAIAFDCDPSKLVREHFINELAWDEKNPFFEIVCDAFTKGVEHDLTLLDREDTFSDDLLLRFVDDN